MYVCMYICIYSRPRQHASCFPSFPNTSGHVAHSRTRKKTFEIMQWHPIHARHSTKGGRGSVGLCRHAEAE